MLWSNNIDANYTATIVLMKIGLFERSSKVDTYIYIF